MLSTRGRPPGKARVIGRPRMGHFYQLFKKALDDDTGEWGAFTWKSSEILSAEEIASAKARMDDLSFRQEYEAEFLSFEGRAYYPFRRETHAREALPYHPKASLIFCFDFNVQPGVAVVCQEQEYVGGAQDVAKEITAVIGEVWIPQNSNTPAVCRKLAADWRNHEGEIHCYGDFTGGARGTAKTMGTDWQIIKDELRRAFGDRVIVNTKPCRSERERINAMNTRLRSADGMIHMLVDPKKAPHVVDDFECVTLLIGGSGEIDKPPGTIYTHMTDGLGDYIRLRWPVVKHFLEVEQIF